MSQWNNNYGSNYNYGSGATLNEILAILGIMFGGPLAIYLFYKGYQLYKSFVAVHGTGHVWGCIIAGIIVFFIMSTVVWAIVEGTLRWWDRVWYGVEVDQKAAQTSYNNSTLPKNNTYVAPKPKTTFFGNTTNKTTGLVAGERVNPPRAVFFGRLDGEAREIAGPWEEKYLNTFELTYWKKQKALKPALETDSTSENDPNRLEMVETTTKIDKWA